MESVTLVTMFGMFSFDATLETESKTTVTLPSYPTESGVRINDHRIIQPNEYRLKGIVASTPMGFTLDSFITRLTRLTSIRPATFLEALRLLQRTGLPFTVVGRYEILRNMLITEIEAFNEAQYEDSLTFDIKLQEFITVNRLMDLTQPITEILNDGDPAQSAISADVRLGELPVKSTINKAAEAVFSFL